MPSDIASCSVARFPRHGAAGPSRTGRRFESKGVTAGKIMGAIWCYGNSSINIPKCFFFWMVTIVGYIINRFMFFLFSEGGNSATYSKKRTSDSLEACL